MLSCVNCILESCFRGHLESCVLRQLMYIRGWVIFLEAGVVVIEYSVGWGRAVLISIYLFGKYTV